MCAGILLSGIKAQTLIYYNDFENGNVVNTYTFTSAANNNVNGLFNVASELKYVTLGGNQAWNWNDPDPAFMFDKVKIYAGALTTAHIASLMSTDEITSPSLTLSKNYISLDDKYLSENLVINALNLTSDIVITGPAGITISPSTISKENAAETTVAVSFNGTTILNDSLTVSSGSIQKKIGLKTFTNENCFTPAYTTTPNMIADPTFSAASLAAGGFSGWGPTAINYATPYCGSGSAYVRGSCWSNGGSLDRTLSAANGNELKANTKYRLRAMIKATAAAGKSFQFQIEGYDGSASKFFLFDNTNGWIQFDTTFVTGATVVTGKGIYFNSCTNASPALTDTAIQAGIYIVSVESSDVSRKYKVVVQN